MSHHVYSCQLSAYQPNNIWRLSHLCSVESKWFNSINCLTLKIYYYERLKKQSTVDW